MKIIAPILLVIMFIALAFNASASERHHHNQTVNQSTTNIYQTDSAVALAAASGQHHYKDRDSLQWSGAGAYSDLEDKSAVSFGLGKQAGDVFITGSFSSDGNSSIIGFSASGSF